MSDTRSQPDPAKGYPEHVLDSLVEPVEHNWVLSVSTVNDVPRVAISIKRLGDDQPARPGSWIQLDLAGAEHVRECLDKAIEEIRARG